jgi:hypothetical protein
LACMYLSVCAGTKESDLVPVFRRGVLLDASETAFVILLGVGGHTTAGKFFENSFFDSPTFKPLAKSTTAMNEARIKVGRCNFTLTPHLRSHVDGGQQEAQGLLSKQGR